MSNRNGKPSSQTPSGMSGNPETWDGGIGNGSSSDPNTQDVGATSGSDLPLFPMFDLPEPTVEPQPRTEQAPVRKRKRLTKAPWPKRWWVWGLVVLGIGAGAGGLYARQVYIAMDRDLPNPDDLLSYVRAGSLTIKAADGSVLQQVGPATREKLSFDQMPELLPDAFIASEDQEFYKHSGVDYQAVIRATLANMLAGEVREGGSTITQQLARIVFLDQERSMGRKLKEAMLAQKIERELEKKQILERYLNLVYLGSGAYGVADAAWIYFGKTANALTLGEMAMIAGMAPAPSVYSPLVNPELAKERRNIVLQRMVDAKFITPAERDQAIATPLTLKPSQPKNLYSETPYFTSYVQEQLPKYVSKEELELGGLTVETTLNVKWQKLAQETVKNAIANYGYGQVFEQAALVSIDPRSGEIRALVGGDDFTKSQFNRATQAQRQPGSTFKTFVYSTAIAAGFSPYKSYVDNKLIVDGYEPHNYGKNYRGAVSMRDALMSSINIVAVKVLIDVGFDPVIQMSKKMGIHSDLIPAYSLALGSSEVNLLELTSAYGTLANRGEHIEPHGITRITNRYGKVIYEAKFKGERALDADSATIMTWMLEGVVNNGTGGNAYLSDRQVAGKTGTSEKRRDLWFIGFIPQMVTGIWLGNDDSSPTQGASSTAALTWYDFMSQLTKEIPPEDFPKLPDVEGREGSIKAKPVTPGRITSTDVGSRDNSDSEGRSDSTWSDPTVDSGSYSGGSSYDSYSSGSSNEPSSTTEEPAPAENATEAPPSEPASTEPPIDSTAPDMAPVDEAPPPISEPPPSESPAEPLPEPAVPAPSLTPP